ncbi:MAG: glycerol-3-phosphate 1-O-acyltransferase PlsY [Rikenellaceae bacterium]
MILNILLIICGYLLGSIPSAVWIGKRFYGIDVREHGSKNAGATNTLRVLGRRAAAPVFAIDILKGFVAVKLYHISTFSTDSNELFILQVILAAAAVLGHIFPVFAKFKGGKGVATIAGALLAIYTLPLLSSLGVFAIVFFISNYVSLGSITAAISFPLFLIFVFKYNSTAAIIVGCFAAALLLFTHRKNIKRLINGTEGKVNPFKKSPKKEEIEEEIKSKE